LRKLVCERIDDEYGLEVPQLFIVNISLPENVEKALDTRSSMGVIGDMNKYQQYQMGTAMTTAAANPGGGAAEGMGLGMGFAMANQMAQNMGRGGVAAAPPPPPTDAWHIAVGGQTQGPFTSGQIAEGISSGQIGAATLLWSANLPAWTAAAQVPQFATRLAVPPPPPPLPK
jgi:membrane protease subunit (stomatin/prohibitin family)